MDLSIIPECYIDTNLVETLVPPQNRYNHQKGCGTVTKVMQENFSDGFAVGIIDKDKNEVDYLKEFGTICQTESLILHKHKTKHHYIIQIVPAMERYIFNCVSSSNLSLADFDLPQRIELFQKESKTVNSKNDERFKKLFKALKRYGCRDVIHLSEIITYLKEQNFNSQEKDLRDILSK